MSVTRKTALAAGLVLVCAGIALALLRTRLPGRAADGPALAHLSSAFGEVSTRRAGTFTFRPAATGENLEAGDSVKTGSASRAVVAYAGGAQVHVDPASLVVVMPQEDASVQALMLAEGAISGALSGSDKGPTGVTVQKNSNEDPVARIDRTGPEDMTFRVRLLDQEGAEVAILHGQADVSRGGRPVRLHGGQAVQLPRQGGPGEPMDLPAFPGLKDPEPDAQLDLSVSGMVSLFWETSHEAATYRVQVTRQVGPSIDFDQPVLDRTVRGVTLPFVPPATGAYIWRVAAVDSGGREGEFGFARRFVVHSLSPQVLAPEEPAGPLPAVARGDIRLAGEKLSGPVLLQAGARLEARAGSGLTLDQSLLDFGSTSDLEMGELLRTGSLQTLSSVLRAGSVVADLSDGPLASLEIRSEEADVRILAGSRTAVEMRGGILRAVCQRGDTEVAGAGRTVRLVAGQAVDVGPGGPGERMTLPGTPELVAPAAAAIVPAGREVRFSWMPGNGAQRYRLLLSASRSMADPLEERIVAGNSASLRLPVGPLFWGVTAIDGSGLSSLHPAIRALVASAAPAMERSPSISIVQPASGAITHADAVELVGHTAPGSKVSVNTSEVMVDPAGGFRARVALRPGSNSIDVLAVDDAGRSSSASLRVERQGAP